MPVSKPEHVVTSCLLKDAESTLDEMSTDYELIGMTSCQVGTGFGAHVELFLAFRLCRETAVTSTLPPGRQRRSPFQAIRA